MQSIRDRSTSAASSRMAGSFNASFRQENGTVDVGISEVKGDVRLALVT